MGAMQEYLKALATNSTMIYVSSFVDFPRPSATKWSPSLEDIVKVNCDAAFDPTFCKTFIGVAIRDNKGTILNWSFYSTPLLITSYYRSLSFSRCCGFEIGRAHV